MTARLATVAVLGVVGAVAAAQPAAADVSFERDVYSFPDLPPPDQNSGPVPSGPTDVELADLDGDGDRDIVVAEGIADKVAVLINNGNGEFQPPVRYDGCDTPLALVVGQLNLATDNHPDVMLSCGAFLAGNGDGTFDPAVPSGVGGRTMLELAQLDGSGGPELVFDAAAPQPFSNILCASFGSGTSWGNTICDTAKHANDNWVGAVRYDMEPVNLSDVPGGPAEDEIVSVYWFNDKEILFSGLSDTAPTVWNTSSRPTGFTGSSRGNSIAAGDIEGDGDNDVVVGDGAGSSFSVFRWGGPGDPPAGGFAPGVPGTIHSTTVSAIEGSAIRDFDGDGKPDVALLGSVGVLGVHPGDGSGGFGSAQTSQAGDANHAHRMVVGDLNGDGKPDAVVIDNPGSTQGAYLAVMLNTTPSPTPPPGGGTPVSGTPPPGTGTPGGGGGGVGGTGEPVLVEPAPGGPPILGGRLRQSIGAGAITVQAACPVGIPGDPCRELAATATVRAPVGGLRVAARTKVFRLRRARAAPVNGRATLRLRIPKRAKRTFMRALRAGRRLRAVVTVSALDGGGQTLGSAQRTIKLKR